MNFKTFDLMKIDVKKNVEKMNSINFFEVKIIFIYIYIFLRKLKMLSKNYDS